MYMGALPYLVIDKEKRNLYFDLSKVEEIQNIYDRFRADDVDYFTLNPKACLWALHPGRNDKGKACGWNADG